MKAAGKQRKATATSLQDAILKANHNPAENVTQLAQLISQEHVKAYLRSVRTDSFVFDLVYEMLSKKVNLRLACEIIEIAANGNKQRLPSYLLTEEQKQATQAQSSLPPPTPKIGARFLGAKKEKEELCLAYFNHKRADAIILFSNLATTLNNGINFSKQNPQDQTSKRDIPGLPLDIIHYIYTFVLAAEGSLDLPVSTAQMLKTAYGKSKIMRQSGRG